MSTVIKVENLSKKYMISHEDKERYVTLRDILTNSTKNIGSRIIHTFTKGKPNPRTEEFWALKNVSFEVKKGERIGIIGRNGAGKSTLLKLLSRITEPTEGRMRIKGRISSLLEVGTGFHPELTGRENIYLNGAILGMSKTEIKNKFDEIVAFSEVEKFLDTPVKRYSSGMQVRLAFAVAAHLEPEILLVDEVLAVGDAQFQKKCLGKMDEVAIEGRTILFVSHNMNAIKQLCSFGILLDNGTIKEQGTDVGGIINKYLFGKMDALNEVEWVNEDNEYRNPWFIPNSMYLTDNQGKRINLPVSKADDIWVYIDGIVEILDPALTIGYAIYSENENLLFWSYQTDMPQESWPKLKKGNNILRSKIPVNLLNEGYYRIELIGGLHFRKWLFEPLVNSPSVNLIIQGGLSQSPLWIQKRPGMIAPILAWEVV